MGKVRVFTDSTADLSKALLNRFNISVIPLYVTIGGQSYKDGVDITTSQMYDLVEKCGELPKTSCPSVADFMESFSSAVDEGDDVIFIGISSGFSVTNQTARIAAKEFDEGRIFVHDSLNLSTGIGLQVLVAGEMAEEGASVEEIKKELDRITPKVRSSFFISTLKYLHMGGRCSAVALIASTLIKIKPQIIVKDGGMTVGEKYRGKNIKVYDSFYKSHVDTGEQIDPHRVFITHSFGNEGAEYLKNKLEENLNIDEVHVTDAGCVISSHCGQGTVGILYIER